MDSKKKNEPKTVPIPIPYMDTKEPFKFNYNTEDGSLEIEPVYEGLHKSNPTQEDKYKYALFSFGAYGNVNEPSYENEFRMRKIADDKPANQKLAMENSTIDIGNCVKASRQSFGDLYEIQSRNRKHIQLTRQYKQMKYGDEWKNHFKPIVLKTQYPLTVQDEIVELQDHKNEKYRQYIEHNRDNPSINTQNRISFISKKTPIENESDDYIDEPEEA